MTTRTVWQLARMADCADPDRVDSPGARFLDAVESATVDAVESGGWDPDTAHEIADGAVPIYTADRWETFADLAAWQEDPTDLGADGSDMTSAAGVCLYLIAERLAHAIAEAEADDTDGPA